ncbi:hypothetical protein FI069_22800 [Salmonella enterica subsp. enterica]|nr:hypothetical protein [Salmonella enterica subsp. enterica serovar India]HCI7190197.1 hypothetical protein [Salmonella enterica]
MAETRLLLMLPPMVAWVETVAFHTQHSQAWGDTRSQSQGEAVKILPLGKVELVLFQLMAVMPVVMGLVVVVVHHQTVQQ